MNIKWKKWAVLTLFLSIPFLSGGTMEEGCPEPVQIPSAPSNLEATRMSCTSTKLTWSHDSSVSVADGFNLYRKCGDGEYEKIAEPLCCEFWDFNVPKGVECTYYITAYNSAGESGPSWEASG